MCRWKARCAGLPVWIQAAPLLFVFRYATHLLSQGVLEGTITFAVSLSIASLYFSYLAHLNHALDPHPTRDFMCHQLGATGDIQPMRMFNDLLLGLDRQTLHHLFPAVAHPLLGSSLRSRVREWVPEKCKHSLAPLRLLRLHSLSSRKRRKGPQRPTTAAPTHTPRKTLS